MTSFYRCPVPRCFHRINAREPREPVVEEMTDHIVAVHEWPMPSASYQAHLLLPITAPKAA
ncbi:MAG TPA: hypothetical protein VIP28_01760 [Nocardioides sp.]